MGLLDGQRVHQANRVVGHGLDGVGARRAVTLASVAIVKCQATEVLDEEGDLKSPAAVVQAEPLDPDHMVAVAVFAVEHLNVTDPHLWHAPIVVRAGDCVNHTEG